MISIDGAAKHLLQPLMATNAAAFGAKVLRPRDRLWEGSMPSASAPPACIRK